MRAIRSVQGLVAVHDFTVVGVQVAELVLVAEGSAAVDTTEPRASEVSQGEASIPVSLVDVEGEATEALSAQGSVVHDCRGQANLHTEEVGGFTTLCLSDSLLEELGALLVGETVSVLGVQGNVLVLHCF